MCQSLYFIKNQFYPIWIHIATGHPTTCYNIHTGFVEGNKIFQNQIFCNNEFEVSIDKLTEQIFLKWQKSSSKFGWNSGQTFGS